MIKRIGVLSLGKVLAAVYAVIGFILGILFALFGLALSSAIAQTGSEPVPGWFGAMFGIIGIIFWPIFYAITGFIFGILTAFVYNLVAGWIGGVELELE